MAGDDTLGQIQCHIKSRESFVVQAGAGAGKTRALVQTIETILIDEGGTLGKEARQIACITFTNVAKCEILDRLGTDDRVTVSTIHEFLWGVMSGFQDELRAEVCKINESSSKPVENLHAALRDMSITYGQFGRRFEKGELHHSDVIAIAHAFSEKYPKFIRIMANRFPIILVDEYQDTDVRVLNLLLQRYVEAPSRPVVGLFGDEMQQIYDSKVTNVAAEYSLNVVTILENYRCSHAVIDVINRLRTDLQQVSGSENRPGSTHLMIGTDAGGSLQSAHDHLNSIGWDMRVTKTLILTHKGIAREAGYADLLAAFSLRGFGADTLQERSDEFGELFTVVEALRASYKVADAASILHLLGRDRKELLAHETKGVIRDFVDELNDVTARGSVRDVVSYLMSSSLLPVGRRMSELMAAIERNAVDDSERFSKKRPSYEAILDVSWREVEAFVAFAESQTPFSTKHGVKGAEYENVLVVIDDSLWNKYKMAHVFSSDSSNANRLDRSRKLLYVCFSRAQNGLAVLCLSPLAAAELVGAQMLLGVDAPQYLPS